MEDIGDIIYYLLLAFVAIVSILGKSKKKKQVMESTEPEEEPKSLFEELEQSWEEFEESLDRTKSMPTEASPAKPFPSVSSVESVPSMEYKPRYEPLSYETTTDFSKLRVKKQIKESVFKSRSFLRVEDLEENDINPIEISLENADEAKMAFIYSEIFNRKYN